MKRVQTQLEKKFEMRLNAVFVYNAFKRNLKKYYPRLNAFHIENVFERAVKPFSTASQRVLL